MQRRLLQRSRLAKLDIALECERFDRARGCAQPPAGGPVGLRQNEGDFVAGFDEPGK
jgi:hypothetical protein